MSAGLVTELTPQGRGGVSVVLVEGADCVARTRRVAERVPGLGEAPRLARLRFEGVELDEALIWRRGETQVELHLHGSPVVVRRVCEVLGRQAALGPRGLSERALGLLAAAPSRAAAGVLLDQAEGSLGRELERWLNGDGDLRASIAADLLQRGEAARLLLKPARVLIAGPVNAGKSTLFNALLGRERVVVSGVAGTTRDLIEERAMFGAFAVDLVDTAGLRAAHGLEAEGQRLAEVARGGADLVLWLSRGEHAPAMQVPVVEFRGWADLDDSGGLAPLVAPQAAVNAVVEAFRKTLGLKQQPHQPGAATPFDDQSRDLARQMFEAPNHRDSRQAVAAALSCSD